MSGIYIHIPFCKQACHYCDFHFSTTLKKKDEMIQALAREIELRKSELNGQTVETIYFGGGTPSILTPDDIRFLMDTVAQHYPISENPEITLEANPDDLSQETLVAYKSIGINRLSIGVQSFFEDDLQLMNRAHSAAESLACLQMARALFDNITIDLIYGIPGLTLEKWQKNVQIALSLDIPHISSYALTVEPKTALHKMVSSGKVAQPSDQEASEHFLYLTDTLQAAGYIHYEVSNFAREGYFSKNNSAYWLGKTYLGIGPSAHSYNGHERSWNIANNSLYLNAMMQGNLPSESETLTFEDRYNEAVMTGLRTIWGVSLARIEAEFGHQTLGHLQLHAQKYLDNGWLEINNEHLITTRVGKFMADGIASDLFLLHLT
ncbi:MAG: radical SAM family heme chaperone HemW [Flavobacteriaceae bacterium]